MQIWPQEIVSTKTDKMMQTFCLRQVHCSSRDSSRPRIFTRLLFLSFFFLNITSMCYSMWHTEPKKSAFPGKANTSVIYMDVVMSTMLLSTMLTKNICMQHASKDKLSRKTNKTNKKIRHINYSCLLILACQNKKKRNLLRSEDNWAKSTSMKSWLMITQHVVKALTTAGHLTYARIYPQLADENLHVPLIKTHHNSW